MEVGLLLASDLSIHVLHLRLEQFPIDERARVRLWQVRRAHHLLFRTQPIRGHVHPPSAVDALSKPARTPVNGPYAAAPALSTRPSANRLPNVPATRATISLGDWAGASPRTALLA